MRNMFVNLLALLVPALASTNIKDSSYAEFIDERNNLCPENGWTPILNATNGTGEVYIAGRQEEGRYKNCTILIFTPNPSIPSEPNSGK